MRSDKTKKKKTFIPHIYAFLRYIVHIQTDFALMKGFQLWGEEGDASNAAVRPKASRVARRLAADVILLHPHTLKHRTEQLLIKAGPGEACNRIDES